MFWRILCSVMSSGSGRFRGKISTGGMSCMIEDVELSNLCSSVLMARTTVLRIVNSMKYINFRGRLSALNIFHLFVIFFVSIPRQKPKTHHTWIQLWKVFCSVFWMSWSHFYLVCYLLFYSLYRIHGKAYHPPHPKKKKLQDHYSAIVVTEVLHFHFWEKLEGCVSLVFFQHFSSSILPVFSATSSKWRRHALDITALLRWINFEQWEESFKGSA